MSEFEITRIIETVLIEKATNGYSVVINYDNSSYNETAEIGAPGSTYYPPIRIVFFNIEQMTDRLKREGL